MKDFVENLFANDMKLSIPAEYLEYLQTRPGEIVYHEPENDEQAAVVAKMKCKRVALLTIGEVLMLMLLVYVIVTKNTLVVISLMGVMVLTFLMVLIHTVRMKPQVVTGRAVIKTKEWRGNGHNNYSYYVAVAVDWPVKTIYSRIPVSKADYEKIQEGPRIMIVNVGKGVVLD